MCEMRCDGHVLGGASIAAAARQPCNRLCSHQHRPKHCRGCLLQQRNRHHLQQANTILRHQLHLEDLSTIYHS
ncbi:hypothetical protein Dsin_024223 [Dipteronia sinensis]|uniref:Uncharacterized protein n=1 Tax=Dipteronia sinensis TaxID=43782 RepID=A0AAD9ZV26_9ROSI|nr:hypothetical protein Dsin_024223 [Dipteronia sinensis]